MTNIDNLQQYNKKMHASLIDKMYFVDKVDAKTFVDIGCADGYMLNVIASLFPDYKYIGYDTNDEMIAVANKNSNGKILFTSDRNALIDIVSNSDDVCLILSSMIHEVYSYSQQVESFWYLIWNQLKAKYVAIRDMALSKSASRPSDPIIVARIRQMFDSNKIWQWQTRWGSLEENWSLVHFLLTYHYDNWEREHKENYLPLTVEELLQLVPREYFPIFNEHYTLPYIRRKVKADFGIELQERTHVKLILERQ